MSDTFNRINDLTASMFPETKAVSEKLWNVQQDEDTYLIKFVEPCPKVEWAGELNRDRHFIVNTESDDPDNLAVSVFNPNHGQNKFHDMTSDRLQNVFLYYREVGDLHWSKARTEIRNDDGSVSSQTVDFAAEYAYEEESNYGYSSLKWALANKVPEGTYEIRVDAECDQLGGPADMDLYSTPIISGVVDLTRPEQYGRALPLRESVLIGEEIAVVFTEPVRCEAFDLSVIVHFDDSMIIVCGQSGMCDLEQPQAALKTSLHGVRCCSEEDRSSKGWRKNDNCDVWVQSKKLDGVPGSCHTAETYDDAKALCESRAARLCTKDELEADCAKGTGCMLGSQSVWTSDSVPPYIELDRNDPPIQIVCDGHKVGFQIDPTQINVEDWIGKKMFVEIGQVNTENIESKSNIFDLNGNAIENNVKFEKTFADIDLDQASTSFTVALDGVDNCSDDTTSVGCTNGIRNKIAALLKMSSNDYDRIEVDSVSAASNIFGGTVNAKIKILPAVKSRHGRMLRHGEKISNSFKTDHSVGLFRELKSAVEREQTGEGRILVASSDTELSSMHDIVIVNVSDMKILPGDSDTNLVTTDPEAMKEEEELYRYASMKSNVGVIQPILSEVERLAMVEEIGKKERGMIDEIESKSKSREEAMISEMKEEYKRREDVMMNKIERMSAIEESLFHELRESKRKSKSELKMLRFELAVITLASVGIALVAYLSLKR